MSLVTSGAFRRAALVGAESVLCVDSSQKSPEWIQRNTELNGVADKVSVRRDDTFEVLRRLRAERPGVFDVVILDPPAFIEKDAKEGALGLPAAESDGDAGAGEGRDALSCSCSYHLTATACAEIPAQEQPPP